MLSRNGELIRRRDDELTRVFDQLRRRTIPDAEAAALADILAKQCSQLAAL
jgi:hypothetical protein